MAEKREKEIYKVTLVGGVVNFLLMVFKFVAGIVGHSSAMIADAVHSLSDFVTDIIVVVFVHISGKPVDADHDYGHGKYETLASVIVGLLLAFVGIGLAWNGIEKAVGFFKGEPLPSPGFIALLAALVSILFKEGLYQYTVRAGRRLNSSAVVANAWHHRSDAMTSLATLVGIGGAMFLGPKWNVLDSIAAIVVSGFILKAAYSLMKPGIDELLEKSLSENDKREIASAIYSTPGVKGFHRLRTRRIGPKVAIDAHIKMSSSLSLKEAHEIASEVERRLKSKYGSDTYIGIHMEPME